jgi:hypothetical protein
LRYGRRYWLQPRMFWLPTGFGGEAELEQAKTRHGGLGLFVRSLAGLDREVAAAVYDFLSHPWWWLRTVPIGSSLS